MGRADRLGHEENRTADLNLVGTYVCAWNPYSNLGGRRGELRYLAPEVS